MEEEKRRNIAQAQRISFTKVNAWVTGTWAGLILKVRNTLEVQPDSALTVSDPNYILGNPIIFPGQSKNVKAP